MPKTQNVIFEILLLFTIVPLVLTLMASASERNGKILIIFAPRAKSHFLSLLPFIRRLLSDGYDVHILNIVANFDEVKIFKNQLNSSNKITFHTIRLSPLVHEKNGKNITKIVQNLIWNKTMHSHDLAFVYQQRTMLFSKILENYSDQFVSLLNNKWDLIILSELFNIHGFGIAQLLNEHAKIPYILFCTSTALSSTDYSRAIGSNLVSIPHRFTSIPSNAFDGFQPNKFAHRLENIIEALLDYASSYYIDNFAIAPKLSVLIGQNGRFSFDKIHSKSALTITDTVAYLGFPKPEERSLLNLGAHCEQIFPLEGKLKDFVDDPTSRGTIYIAFGTFISFDHALPNLLNNFLKAFEHFPEYRFIFSMPNYANFSKLNYSISSNIRLVKWAPQLNLLGHKKTKLFITHCGLKSIKEAICTETPMLAMPMYAEQNHNAKLIYQYGLGLMLNKFLIHSNNLQSLISQMLNDSIYLERAKKMKRIFLDRPAGELDIFSYHIRKLISKGKILSAEKFTHLLGKELNFLNYFYFDLTLLILFFIYLFS